MSVPTTFEFAVIQIKTGTGNTASDYTTLCGIQTTGFNNVVQTNDRFVRDCTAPAALPERKVRRTGRQRDLTGSGLYNIDQIDLLNASLGAPRTYRYLLMDVSDPAVPAGTLLGTWEGPGVMTSLNTGTSDSDDATVELAIASNGVWTYTDA